MPNRAFPVGVTQLGAAATAREIRAGKTTEHRFVHLDFADEILAVTAHAAARLHDVLATRDGRRISLGDNRVRRNFVVLAESDFRNRIYGGDDQNDQTDETAENAQRPAEHGALSS